MNNRTKALDVSPSVRSAVLKRDKHCIFCKRTTGLTMAHVISRGQGGLGIEENLVAACSICHHLLDHTTKRKVMIEYAERHLRKFYGEVERTYKK